MKSLIVAFAAFVLLPSVASAQPCTGTNQTLQWVNQAWQCAQVVAPFTSAPICDIGESPSWDGSTWSCKPASVPPTPPTCIGANKALQWMNGWLCTTIVPLQSLQ